MGSIGMHIFIISEDFVCLFFTIGLEIGGQELILSAVQVSVFPIALGHLCRSVADVLPVHLFQCVEKVSGLGEGNETVASGLASSPISNDPGHIERRVLGPENIGKNFIGRFIAQIADKNPVIILRPLFHSLVLPDEPSSFPQHMSFLFLTLIIFIFFWLLYFLGLRHILLSSFFLLLFLFVIRYGRFFDWLFLFLEGCLQGYAFFIHQQLQFLVYHFQAVVFGEIVHCQTSFKLLQLKMYGVNIK